MASRKRGPRKSTAAKRKDQLERDLLRELAAASEAVRSIYERLAAVDSPGARPARAALRALSMLQPVHRGEHPGHVAFSTIAVAFVFPGFIEAQVPAEMRPLRRRMEFAMSRLGWHLENAIDPLAPEGDRAASMTAIRDAFRGAMSHRTTNDRRAWILQCMFPPLVEARNWAGELIDYGDAQTIEHFLAIAVELAEPDPLERYTPEMLTSALAAIEVCTNRSTVNRQKHEAVDAFLAKLGLDIGTEKTSRDHSLDRFCRRVRAGDFDR